MQTIRQREDEIMMRMSSNRLQTRANPEDDLAYRSSEVRKPAPDQAPATIDMEQRSVDVVAATENPVMVMDYDRWELVQEVLLMSGLKLPQARQMPLLDSHSRYSTSDVIGSARDLRVDGSILLCRAFFSSVPPAPDTFTKVAEGHLTDFSIGYRVNQSVWIPEGQTQVVNGRTFQGPVKVVTDWTVRELSATPIGADEEAKARSEHHARKEAHKMPEWLKRWLEEKGLYREGMTEEEARALFDEKERKQPEKKPEGSASSAKKDEKDDEKVRSEAYRAEQDRILEIRAMCERFACLDLVDDLVRNMATVDQARKTVMDKVSQKFEGGKGFSPARMDAGEDERDKFRAAAGDSILIRMGQIADLSKAAPGGKELASYTLRELARECLRMAGQPTGGNALELVGRALVSSDLPYLLAAGANRMLLNGWSVQNTTYQLWCGIDSLPDFKTMNLVNISEADDLDEVPEGTKYNHGDIRDSREQAYLLTYGKIFAITRQAIINDDLNAMMRVPEAYGRAARRKVNSLAYAVLTANANMADGITLFHSSHGNVGTSAVIGTTSIGEAFKLMRVQKGPKSSEPLNIIPRYLVAPANLEGSSEAFFNTIQIANAAGSVLLNEYAGSRITRVYDPILDATDATDWYMAAEKGMTVTVFFLQGQQEPYLEQQQGWNVDGTELKVRIDAAAKAVDWRGLTFNEGGS